MALEPMTPGGEWLSNGSSHPPVYQTNPDNIAHMLKSGWFIVPDPRVDPEAEAEPPAALVEPPRRSRRGVAAEKVEVSDE